MGEGAMPADMFLRGLAIGVAVAAPVGPIGLLCINRTLTAGFAAGLATGLGAATADAAYGAVAAFGLAALGGAVSAAGDGLRLAGGLFLLYLGVRAFRKAPPAPAAQAGATGLVGGYLTSVVLTLVNPATILSFAAIFAGLGLAGTGGFANAAALVAGVFLGSAAWWLFLSAAGTIARRRLPPGALRWINRLSGVIFAGFGLWALAGLVIR